MKLNKHFLNERAKEFVPRPSPGTSPIIDVEEGDTTQGQRSSLNQEQQRQLEAQQQIYQEMQERLRKFQQHHEELMMFNLRRQAPSPGFPLPQGLGLAALHYEKPPWSRLPVARFCCPGHAALAKMAATSGAACPSTVT